MKLLKKLLLPALAALSAMGIFFASALQYSPEKSHPSQPDGKLQVHFLDVGQGDATLIVCDGEAMLIDAGENDKGTLVQNHLIATGIDSLRYMIGTHPDSDHIGGMDVILYKFDCDTVIMPEFSRDTAAYRDVIDTMKQKGYANTVPVVGDTYTLGGATFTILAPVKTYEDSNNNSVAILLTYGNTRFLFTGDAEEEAEKDILASGLPLQADVYKAGHHGSSTSSSEEFLRAVNPTYSVISCAENNDYGHPHAEVLNTLRTMGIQVFRTDEQGSLIATCDGKTITWSCSPTDSWLSGSGAHVAVDSEDKTSGSSGTTSNSGTASDTVATYICNTSTMKFHKPDCSSVEEMRKENQLKIKTTRDDLLKQGYQACGGCKP